MPVRNILQSYVIKILICYLHNAGWNDVYKWHFGLWFCFIEMDQNISGYIRKLPLIQIELVSDLLGSSIFWRRKIVRLLSNLRYKICGTWKHIEVKSFLLLASGRLKPEELYLDSVSGHKDSSKLQFVVRHGNQKWLLYTLRRFPYLVSLPNPNWTKTNSKTRLKNIIIHCMLYPQL